MGWVCKDSKQQRNNEYHCYVFMSSERDQHFTDAVCSRCLHSQGPLKLGISQDLAFCICLQNHTCWQEKQNKFLQFVVLNDTLDPEYSWFLSRFFSHYTACTASFWYEGWFLTCRMSVNCRCPLEKTGGILESLTLFSWLSNYSFSRKTLFL